MPAASIAAVSDDIFRITNPLARRYRVGTRQRNRVPQTVSQTVSETVSDTVSQTVCDPVSQTVCDPEGSPGGRGKACYSVSRYQNCHFEWR